MTTLTTKSFTTLVGQWAAVVQSNVAAANPNLVLSFTKGAVLRALAEAQASVSLWLQGLILKLLMTTRLATSQGFDVDTWVADFDMTRLPANAATGLVTFSRATPTNPATIPIGALVQSADGTQTFTVTADTTNSAYSANANGYVIPAQVASLQVPVANTVPGAAGNVQAGGISILQTGISGVDTITNVAAFVNGFDEESATALRVRFVLFIASLAKATEAAIGYAITSVQQGLQYQLFEPGVAGFTVLTLYIDDGTGNIPTATLTAAQDAAQAVRAAGVQMGVFAASKLAANVVMAIATADGYYHPTVVAQVVAALGLYINGIGLGVTPAAGQVSYARLSAVAFSVPGVTDVLNWTLNGGTLDLVPLPGQTIKANNLIVS